MLDLKPHLLKHVVHLRLLPPNRHTQIRDPILLPRIFDRFTKLRIVELVNLDFTPQSIQEHLCDLDSTKDKYITNPLKLDRFAIYATPETILPINAVIFFLLLVSEAKSFLLQTDPKTMWSVYANNGSAQAADTHTLGTSFIPRRGCLKTTAFSLKSCSLPFDIVQYLIWAGTFQTKSITKFYLQADHRRLRNFYTCFRPVHPHLLELTLDLSRYVVPNHSACSIISFFLLFLLIPPCSISVADLFPMPFTSLQSLQKLWLKVPLVSGARSTIFKAIVTLAFRGIKSISSLRFFSLTIVDLEDKRLNLSTTFRLIPTCKFAATLLAPAEKDPAFATTSSLDSLEVMLTGELGQPYKVPPARQSYITDRLPNLHSSGVLSIV